MNNKVLEQLKNEYNEAFNRMQDLGEIIANCADIDTSHCGKDADMDDACCQARGEQQEGFSYKDLLGMEVMFVSPRFHKCGDCTFREGADGSECPCIKVELVGGDCLCLAKHQQDEHEIPTISFEEDDEESLGDIMAKIKEDTDAFMDYLDSIVNNKKQ